MAGKLKRKCGDCQLCCKLLPMPEFGKAAGARCSHQRHGIGCNIYARRPAGCAFWTCRWLTGEDTGLRPDHAHYVVDIMPDFVTVVQPDGSEIKVPVLQVWIDPHFPDAHRDPRLRAYLEREQTAALIRYDREDAFVLAPPSANANGQWFEGERMMSIGREHTAVERIEACGPMRIDLLMGE